ncbi:MAG: glycosyltransferase family 4 protein, partial [Bacillota bacterium]
MVFILVFLTSFLISYILTPHARNFAIWLGSIDKPGARRIHQTAVPSSGGMAIFLGFLLSILIYSRMNQLVLGILLGGFFIFIVGLIDDLYEISPRLKLFGQVVAAVIPLLFGVNIAFITNPMGGMFYLGYWGIPLTILWIVGITNTVNLIDGLDGLAAGISTIAALTLFLVGL